MEVQNGFQKWEERDEIISKVANFETGNVLVWLFWCEITEEYLYGKKMRKACYPATFSHTNPLNFPLNVTSLKARSYMIIGLM